jgi:hypothetical protein
VGKKYTVISYGQDGKPGGEGSDVDLSVDRDLSNSLSFTAFLNHNRYGELVWTIVLIGIISTWLGLIFLSANASGALPSRKLPIRFLTIFILTLFISSVLTVLATFDGFG